jgi:hypothetical protein
MAFHQHARQAGFMRDSEPLPDRIARRKFGHKRKSFSGSEN